MSLAEKKKTKKTSPLAESSLWVSQFVETSSFNLSQI